MALGCLVTAADGERQSTATSLRSRCSNNGVAINSRSHLLFLPQNNGEKWKKSVVGTQRFAAGLFML